MINRVFTRVGQKISIADTYRDLQNLIPNDPYKAQKAAGSIGGAVKNGFIKLNSNGMYERMR